MKGVHWIDLGQWPASLAVITDSRTYGRFLRQKCGKSYRACPAFPKSNAGICQMLEGPEGTIVLISIGKTADPAERILTLVHEATHAMRWVLENAAEASPGTETEAYLVEHIVRHGLEAIADS